MPLNSLGKEFSTEESIFPLISFNPDKNIWKCVGTGFFINGLGGFITAKHVFFDNHGNHLPTLYAVQTTTNNERHVRSIQNLVLHPTADIAIGFLGKRKCAEGKTILPEIATAFTLNMNVVNNKEFIKTYSFPLSQSIKLENDDYLLSFTGKWSQGMIEDYLIDGTALLRHKCYQTTMEIEFGASGGPVLYNNLVIGVNSTQMNMALGETPVSFVTPISYILDLKVPGEGQSIIPVLELIRLGTIKCK